MNLDFDQVPVVTLLHTIAEVAGENIIINSTVTGRMSIHLKHISSDAALQAILSAEQLGMRKVAGNRVIAPLDYWRHDADKQRAYEASLPPVSLYIPLKYANAKALADLLSTHHGLLSTNGVVSADTRTNGLLIVDAATRLASIRALIARLDVPDKQVMITARIVSIDRDQETALGIRFSALSVQLGQSDGYWQDNLAGQAMPSGLALFSLNPAVNLTLELSALEAKGMADVMSSPKIMTENRQTASIEAGQEIPYQEKTRGGSTSVTFKKAVLSLKVTPEVIPGRKILLHLQVSQDKPSDRDVQGVPAIDTRRISTEVLVNDGQTVVLGGIYERTHSDQHQRVPFLAAIPGFGQLFRYDHHSETTQELLVFVTPQEVREQNEKK